MNELKEGDVVLFEKNSTYYDNPELNKFVGKLFRIERILEAGMYRLSCRILTKEFSNPTEKVLSGEDIIYLSTREVKRITRIPTKEYIILN